MTLRGTRDIASVPVEDAGHRGMDAAVCLYLFVGAVRLAEQMGHRVEVRTIRGPHDRVHSLVASIPAEACGD